MAVQPVDSEGLLTPSEVADLFHVDPKTVTRWARSGKISSIRTLGGHRRYRVAEVRALLGGAPPLGSSSLGSTARVPRQPVSTRD